MHYYFCYHSVFFGRLIFRGKKAKAFNMFLKIKEGLKQKELIDPVLVFYVAMIRMTPHVLLFPIKKSGATEAAPFPIGPRKQVTFAVKWAIKTLKDSHGKVTVPKLVDVLVSAIYNKGPAIEKKREVYRKASNCRHFIKFYR